MSEASISTIMSHDHRECDIKFEDIESLVQEKNFEKASELFTVWKNVNLRHFEIEETILFPETANKMGGKIPPIMVMEMEHIQIKKCIDDMANAMELKNSDSFMGLADTCLIMIQQHNMKEEQILYPIIDRSLIAQQQEYVMQINGKLNS